MPGTGCPICGGHGKVPGAIYGIARASVQCQTCNSEGKVKLNPTGNKVNPAYIMPTGSREHADDDPLSQRVDWIICNILTDDQKTVIMFTYTTSGTQEHKARKAGVSREHFSRLLGKAHDLIMLKLDTERYI